jgi:hypothetical protein
MYKHNNNNINHWSWRGIAVISLFALQTSCLLRPAAKPEPETAPAPKPEPVQAPVAAETQFNELKVEPVPDSEISQPLVPVKPDEPDYDPEDVLWIQQRLQELGYYVGPVDGSVGSATRDAISEYQTEQGVEADGQPTGELRDFMWRNGG